MSRRQPARHQSETTTDTLETPPQPTADTQSESAPAQDQATLCGPDSATDPTISVVIPTLNEQEGIAICIEAVLSAFRELGVPGEIVVADSSTDATPDIARSYGAVVTEPERNGYGAAYLDGFATARGDIIAMGDADTTYDFTELPKLVSRMHETNADLVIGSRLDGQILPGSMPTLHQYIGNPLLTKMLNSLFGSDFSDTHSGFRVFTQEALAEMDPSTTGMEFASEMLIGAARAELHVEEIPITYHPRVGEAKLESFKDGWRHVRYMLKEARGTTSVIGSLVSAFR